MLEENNNKKIKEKKESKKSCTMTLVIIFGCQAFELLFIFEESFAL